jgi:hypothetical protein
MLQPALPYSFAAVLCFLPSSTYRRESFILSLKECMSTQSDCALCFVGVILASLNSRMEFIRRQLAAIDEVFWRGDHTYQAASRIRSAAGSKDFAAIYSIMNEWGQIVAQWAVGDSSFDEYVHGLQAVIKRYEELGLLVRTAFLEVLPS